MINFFFKYGLL